MKIVLSLVIAALVLGAVAPVAFAQETKPINLALFDPVQIFKKDVPIKGFRFNLIYGNNSAMTGLDMGFDRPLAGAAAHGHAA